MPKHLIFLFLIILFLPIVNANPITGTFSNYGEDTDGDGLFNYLIIEVEVDITDTAIGYDLSGTLKDMGTYDDGCGSLSYGKHNIKLYFDGSEIYRKKLNGPYQLSRVELSAGTCGNGMELPNLNIIDSLSDIYTKYYDYTEFQKGKPAVYCNNSPCIANSSLISSRDNIAKNGGPNPTDEPNAPNTIDNCKDGTKGKYLLQESIENITITSLNNTFFGIGDTVKADIWVYCASTFNELNIVYANNADNIQWNVKRSLDCNSLGFEKLSTTFKLDNNVGSHAVRGVLDRGLSSNTVCIESDYADTDDVVIYVKEQTSEPEPQGHRINLTQGWNLISLPKITNNDITAIADIFDNNFEKIITLKNNKYYLYDKSSNSNLNELSEADGFWIKVDNAKSILIEDESTPYTTINLTTGWNLIGYPSLEEKDVNELFQNVMGDIELIYTYSNEFHSFNPKNPSALIIKPGTGIFIKAKNNINWNFNGTYNKEETQEEPLETFNLSLSQGWNLISIPITSEQTINDIFSSKILYYLENSKWKQLRNSDKINYSYTYWIKSNEDSIIIEGDTINNLDFNINQGWNMINYPLRENKDTDIFFNNVMGNIESIATYENQEWKTYNPLKSTNSLTILNPGKGIFIKAKSNEKWNFNGNILVAT